MKALFVSDAHALLHACLRYVLASTLMIACNVKAQTAKAISPSFFGMHIHYYGDAYPWPTIPFGSYRNWDNGTRWSQTNTAPGVYNWTRLDYWLAALNNHQINAVGFTLSSTPKWASSNPYDGQCDEGVGSCDLPNDLNADGSGTDATWKAWVTALATHVNDPTYLQTHHRINWYEIWNEWYRNDRVLPATRFASISVRATYAQMVRLTEDARCIITGKGNVMGVPCTSPAIDPNALIVAPSTSGHWALARQVMQNLLYCNASLPPGVSCPTGMRGSAAIDVINGHFYEIMSNGSAPEDIGADILAYKGMLNATDKTKPLYSDETAMGYRDFGGTTGTNEDLQAAFVARMGLVAAGAGMDQWYWYAWNGDFARALNPYGQPTAATTAYQTLYNWLVGAAFNSPCLSNATIWTCALSSPVGSQEEAVWDTSRSCSEGVCTFSQLQVPSLYTKYETLEGTTYTIVGHTVPVGIKPILLLY